MMNEGETKIPKIIWALWIDFNSKKNGEITEDLMFFSNRIRFLHPDYQVNIITEWKQLVEYVKEEEMIIKLLDNTHVISAHKADVIRWFLLKNHGGIWIDLSTFLLAPVDSLIENKSFVCFYASTKDAEQWIIKPFENIYNNLSFKERQVFLNNQENYISLKDVNFDFIPENYFICSTKDHEITSSIYKMLNDFWTKNIELMVCQTTMAFYINLYMLKLIKQIFNINLSQLTEDFIPNRDCIYLKDIVDCGYLFNYLQMYISIRDYCKNLDYTESYINNEVQSMSLFKMDKYCDNIEFIFKDTRISLLSATFIRTLKWSDKLENRMSWEGTYLGELIKNVNTQEEANVLLNLFIDYKIYQFKFGSWTRNSTIISLLKKWYDPVQPYCSV